MKAFGTEFIILNSTLCHLPTPHRTPDGEPYMHLATIRRGFKEYVAYMDARQQLVWIEEIDPSSSMFFKQIEDDKEWADLKDFLYDAKLLEIGIRREVPVSEALAKRLGLSKKRKKREI